MSDLLRASDVTFSYAKREVLRGVSLTLAAGEIVALLGPNGCGKSTLIRTLLGQLRGGGSISWDDREIKKWRPNDLAKRVAYLPQSPGNSPEQTVGESLRSGRAPYWGAFGLESSHDIDCVQRVSQRLQLYDLLNRPMETLSGGQRQRVLIGRCLVQEPAALLLDEPDTFLDLKHQFDLAKLLRELCRVDKIAVLLASHDLNLAANLADRVIVLHEGKIIAEGLPRESLQPTILSQVYGIEMQRIDREGSGFFIHPASIETI